MRDANLLGVALADALRAFRPASESPVPCSGRAPGFDCHAAAAPECTKLVVRVGDPRATPALALHPPSPSARTIWVLPAGARVPSTLPGAYGAVNAASYGARIEQAVPELLALLGVAPHHLRIFVSYRRRDAHELAEQLFDACSHAGFDVFLDRFRIPPGHDFQTRIEQELSDKAMVVVVESKEVASSPWVVHEVAFARSRGMGLFGVRLPGAAPLASIDPALRFEVRRIDLKFPHSRPRLRPSALERLVSTLKEAHGRAIAHRQRAIRATFAVALRWAGATRVRVGARRFLEATSTDGSMDYRIHVVPRTPELDDFHDVSSSLLRANGGPVRPVVFGPIGMYDPNRRSRLDWLASVSRIDSYDEGEILSAAERIASGR